MKKRIKELFATIDRKDADGFASFLTEDANFRFANTLVVHNRETIRDSVFLFFTAIKKLCHCITDVWEQDGVIICEGVVAYTQHDGRELTLPFVNILRTKGDLFSDYRIYIDISALNLMPASKQTDKTIS